MNILYLDHYAGSPTHGMEYRPYYLSREWVRLGHRVRIVAASWSHVRAVQPQAPRRPAPLHWAQAVDGIDYEWWLTPGYRGNGVGRVLNIAAFLTPLFLTAGRIAREFAPDVVIASSTYPMDIWVARRIARLAKARLVFEVHDIWPLSPIELGGMSPSHPFIRVCQAAEDAAYRCADTVVSMLPCVHDHMAAHGLDLSRLHVVPNGVSPDDWDAPAEPLRADLQSAIDRSRAAGRTLVAYAGSHGVPNALDVLLDSAALLGDDGIDFVLVGDGMEKSRLQQRVEREGLARVQLFEPIPKAQVPALLAAVDIAYIGWRRSPLYRFGIAPNKLLDYMMAGVPVLHSVEAGNDPVADAGCGLTVAAESPAAVAEGLRALAAMPPAVRSEMGQRGRDHVLRHHAYPALAERFLRACES